MTKISDGIKAVGAVNIRVYKNEELVKTIVENNLVVTLGKTNIAKLLGGDPAGTKISKIGVGTSSTPAAVEDSALTGVFSKPLESASYPDALTVQFDFDIDNDEANGMTIREFGLLNDNDVLCARKVRAGEIVKTSAVRIVGSWKITIN